MTKFALETNMTNREKFYICNNILASIDSQFRQNREATVYIDDKKIHYSKEVLKDKLVSVTIKEICSVVGLDFEKYFEIEKEELKKNNNIW